MTFIPRKKHLIVILLVLIVVFLFLKLFHWQIKGFIYGESFYYGQPSSYWGNELSVHLEEVEKGISKNDSSNFLIDSLFFWVIPIPSFWESEDPKKIPVQIDLLDHPDPRVRMYVIHQLSGYPPKYRKELKLALPKLIKNLSEKSSHPYLWGEATVADFASSALIGIDPEISAKLGIKGDPKEILHLLGYIESENPKLRLVGTRRLYCLSFVLSYEELKPSISKLRIIVDDSFRDDDYYEISVGELASLTLKSIEEKNPTNNP